MSKAKQCISFFLAMFMATNLIGFNVFASNTTPEPFANLPNTSIPSSVDVVVQAGEDADKIPTQIGGYQPETLRVKYTGLTEGKLNAYTRNTLLKFNIADLNTEGVGAIELKLQLSKLDKDELNPNKGFKFLNLSKIPSTWAAETVTWNNTPKEGGAVIREVTSKDIIGSILSVDITQAILNAKKANETEISFLLEITDANNENLIAFHSSRATTEGVVKPNLTITKKSDIDGLEPYYGQLRTKWFNRLTGNTISDPKDSDYMAEMINVVEKAQPIWDEMNKRGDTPTDTRTELWSKYNAVVSAHVTYGFRNLLQMAAAYNSKGCTLYLNEDLKKDILDGLDWMYANRYNETISTYNNWWDWDIGAPQALGDLLILMYDYLSPEQIANYVKAFNRFNPEPINVPGGPNPMTGGNLLDTALVSGLKGLIAESDIAISQAAAAISSALPYVTKGDGFYVDGSYIQHTDDPYAGGYGSVLLSSLDKLLFITAGTPWELSDPQVGNIYNWILQAFKPLYYKGAIMDMVTSRGVSRQGASDHTRGRGTLQPMLQLSYAAPEAIGAEIRSFIKENIKNDDVCKDYYKNMTIQNMLKIKEILADASIMPTGDLDLHKVYGSMDRVVHHKQGYSLGLSMYSSRVSAFEYGNTENKKGYHTADGMMYLYNDDHTQFSDEYWPTADMMRLPGITTDKSTVSLVEWDSYLSSKDWVGGSSIDDKYGAAGMDFEMAKFVKGAPMSSSSLVGKKSWFSFDDEIVCIGSGITASDNRLIETIVENRKINGDNQLLINGEAKIPTLGSTEKVEKAKWAMLSGNVGTDNIGYYFPEEATVTALRETRTGNWKDINDGGSADPVSRNYLSLAIEHGNNPENEKYSYVLLPNKDAAQMEQYSQSPDITILSNTTDVQAVKENKLGVIGFNFWNASSVAGVTSNAPASTMLEVTDNTIEVSVSDPTQKASTIELEIAVPVTGVASNDSTVVADISSGTIKLTVDVAGSAGKSHKIVLNRDNAAATKVVDVVNPEKIFVNKGVEFSELSLPKTITAVKNNMEVQELSVTWKAGSYDKTKDGDYEIVGTLEEIIGLENNIEAKAIVSVGDIEILSAVNPEKIDVERGTSFEKLNLAKKVSVKASDNKTYEVDVKWSKGDYNENINSLYKLTGEIQLPSNLHNTKNVKVTIEVMVGNIEIVSLTNPAQIDVNKGTDFTKVSLPAKVSVLANDTKTYEVDAKWNKGNYDKDVEGIYQVFGTLQLPANLYNPKNLYLETTIRVGSKLAINEDGYVSGGSKGDAIGNFASGYITMITPESSTAPYEKTLLKFDISSVPKDKSNYFVEVQVRETKLKEFLNNCELYNIDPNWTGKDITFNKIQRIDPNPLATFNVKNIADSTLLKLDVTEAVKKALAENKKYMAFEFTLADKYDGATLVFWSREGTATAIKPALTWSNSDIVDGNVEITKVTNPEAQIVPYGTTEDKLQLPKTVTVELASGEKTELLANWSFDGYNGNVAGEHTLIASLTLPKGILNTANHTASIIINVTKISPEEFEKVIAEAKKTLKNQNATPEELLKAISDIADAITDFEK